MKRLSILSITLIMSLLIGTWGPHAPLAPLAYADADSAPPEVDGWVHVSTAQQLIFINENQEDYVASAIQLMNDIDLSEYNWIPFGGNEFPEFSGTFDGRGYLVSGLEITGDTRLDVGFFGAASGTIRNLGVEVNVTGGSMPPSPNGGTTTGGLVGNLTAGTIDHSYSLGTIIGGKGGSYSSTGGLVGQAIPVEPNPSTVISNSYSTASVQSGTSSNTYTGGLVGVQGRGEISNSYATGAVSNLESANYSFTAGLAGNLTNGTIDKSYATGTVSVTGVGSNTYMAGFAGSLFMNASITNSYFDTLTTGQSNAVSNYTPDQIVEVTGRMTAAMQQEAAYTDWDFSTTWTIHPEVNSGYPYLRPVILTTALPNAIKDTSYSEVLTAFDGATNSLTWSATGLPEGMSVSADGVLQGTPTQSGTFNIAITATDAGSASATATLQLAVDELAPNLTNFSIQPGSVFGSTKVFASSDQPNHTFAYIVGNSEAIQPLVGASLPAEATAYAPGEDIVNVSAGQYLSIYELDADSLIQAWHSVLLEESYIQATKFVTGVTIVEADFTLQEGENSEPLTALVSPDDATNPTVAWHSSDTDIAAIDPVSGVVTAIASGTAVITVTTEDGSHTANVSITVQPAPATVGTITGTVYGTGNSPLSGAVVSMNDISTTTDHAGSFSLLNIAEGTHTITVAASGYRALETSVTVIAGESTDTGIIRLTVAAVNNTYYPVTAQLPDITVTINGSTIRMKTVKETSSDGRSVTRLLFDPDSVAAMFATAQEVIIDISLTESIVKMDMPSEAIQHALNTQPDAAIQMQVHGASYRLPLKIWSDVPSEAVITVAIAKAPDGYSANLKTAWERLDYEMLANPIDYSIYIDGQEMTDWGAVYTKRTIKLDASADPRHSTVVWVDADNVPHFIPSVFTTVDNIPSATFYAPHNSIYTVVQSNHVFKDMQGHWAQEDIHKLANKFIVHGAALDHFAPNSEITRAEFAVMLVRSLGLAEKSDDSSFTDVPSAVWYAGAVKAAKDAGLIDGYSDGTFRPHAPITREQMAAMIARSIHFAGTLPLVDDHAALLQRFTDHALIADWAKQPVLQLLSANIVHGLTDAAFAPQELATRAQSAVILKRMLQYLQFIN